MNRCIRRFGYLVMLFIETFAPCSYAHYEGPDSQLLSSLQFDWEHIVMVIVVLVLCLFLLPSESLVSRVVRRVVAVFIGISLAILMINIYLPYTQN